MSRHRIEYRPLTLADASLAARLRAQVAFAAREARRDPRGFVRALLASDPLDRRSRRALWSIRLGVPAASGFGFLLGVLAYALFVGVSAPTAVAQTVAPNVTFVAVPPSHTPSPAPRAPGGGGSGNDEPVPVSRGVRPPSSLADPVVSATTKPVPPQIDPLPVPPPVKADPLPRLDGPYGDPKGPVSEPSDGPGKGGGFGTGTGIGAGPGDGPGGGPGKDGGPGGPGKGPGGDPRETATPLATKAVILNSPRPSYTELARQNKAEGVVTVRLRLGADGRVHDATVVRGLGYGLDERAIEAASRIDFRPATAASGRPVDSWITVSVRFTIR